MPNVFYNIKFTQHQKVNHLNSSKPSETRNKKLKIKIKPKNIYNKNKEQNTQEKRNA